MQLSQQINIKPFYRITGTPENFLTALRHQLWGFNENNRSKWEQLEPGEIVFFHSKGSGSFFSFKQASAVIGFGIVGNKFFIDKTPLWIDEIERGESYPYRFYFSELYLFYDVPLNDEWDSASFRKQGVTQQILQNLINNGIPLSELDSFPHMGSYSSIRNENVKHQLIAAPNTLYYYQGYKEEDVVFDKKTKLEILDKKDEVARTATSLMMFDDIQQKVIVNGSATKSNNIEAQNKAEKSHFDILSYLFTLLQNKGYEILKNNHVDLFAHNGQQSLLIEAKSIENKNFISQSRKGIVQLFEYNYFEVAEYKSKHRLSFATESNVLVTSKEPAANQEDYIRFINSMGIKTAAVDGNSIVRYGESIDFNAL